MNIAVKHIINEKLESKVKITLGETKFQLPIEDARVLVGQLIAEISCAAIETAIVGYVEKEFIELEPEEKLVLKIKMLSEYRESIS